MRNSSLFALFLIAGLISAGANIAHADEAETMERGRSLTGQFQDNEMDAMWDLMTPQMREAIGSVEALAKLRAQVIDTYGSEREILSEDYATANGLEIYARVAAYTAGAARIVTQFAFDREGHIAGFFIRPQPQPAKSSFLDYQTRAELRLPFDGEWKVYWGGRTIEQNYHAANKAQRFAYDFIVERSGSSHIGDGAALADYHCWEKPIHSPAEGTVVTVVDGLPDQEIGSRDPEHPAGNHVVLDFGNGEFGFLAHMKNGSVTVKKGDKVASGATLGLCGNSGNTSEPHLHFHVQNSANLESGEGLPAQFHNYVADGAEIPRGEPVRGQTIKADD